MQATPRYWKGLDRTIEPLGLGCWQLAGEYRPNGKAMGWGAMEQKEAIALVHQALDRGIEFFDTAAGYGGGLSETLLGKALRSSPLGTGAVVCTKQVLEPNELADRALGRAFRTRVEGSLARLQRARIDVLLLHSPPDDLAWASFDTRLLDDLQHEGKIGTYGISARSLRGVQNMVDAAFGTCVQWVLHLMEQRPVTDLFPRLAASGVNFIARSPLSRGLLAERYLTVDPVFDPKEFRSTLPADWVQWTLEHLRAYPWKDTDPSSLSIRYSLSWDAMSVVIPGARGRAQLNALLNARKDGPLSPTELEEIRQLLPSHYPAWG